MKMNTVLYELADKEGASLASEGGSVQSFVHIILAMPIILLRILLRGVIYSYSYLENT